MKRNLVLTSCAAIVGALAIYFAFKQPMTSLNLDVLVKGRNQLPIEGAQIDLFVPKKISIGKTDSTGRFKGSAKVPSGTAAILQASGLQFVLRKNIQVPMADHYPVYAVLDSQEIKMGLTSLNSKDTQINADLIAKNARQLSSKTPPLSAPTPKANQDPIQWDYSSFPQDQFETMKTIGHQWHERGLAQVTATKQTVFGSNQVFLYNDTQGILLPLGRLSHAVEFWTQSPLKHHNRVLEIKSKPNAKYHVFVNRRLIQPFKIQGGKSYFKVLESKKQSNGLVRGSYVVLVKKTHIYFKKYLSNALTSKALQIDISGQNLSRR